MGDTVEGLWTDGACSGNPGPGGWAAIMRWKRHERELSGGEPETTNNRMELKGVIEGLRALAPPPPRPGPDGLRLPRAGFTQAGWTLEAHGWQTAAKKPVENQDLWERLATVVTRHIVFRRVSGHAGSS